MSRAARAAGRGAGGGRDGGRRRVGGGVRLTSTTRSTGTASSSNVTESVDVPTGVRVVDTWRMADGRIVVAGDNGALGSNCDVLKWWVGRFTADGQPDPTFGGGTGAVEFVPQGVSTCFTQTSDPLRMGAVAVQSTGKIVVGGGPSMTLVRLNVDGSPDPSFPKPFWPAPPSSGHPGCLPPDHLRGGGEIWDLAIDPHDDTVLAAGRVSPAGVHVRAAPAEHAVGERPGRVPLRRGRARPRSPDRGAPSRPRCHRCSSWRCCPTAHRSPRRARRCTGSATSNSP